MDQVPVTVLTGYLGAGKTTLLNRLLTEQHGRKFAVIVNEFGELGIDNDLVVDAEEEVFEMNNGCICCTVRGDLIRIIEGLMKRKGRFDAIVIETTGLADPAPVAQTFFVDQDVRSRTRLDSIITVVDAKNFLQRLEDSHEAAEQVAFADIVLLNRSISSRPRRRPASKRGFARSIRWPACTGPIIAPCRLRSCSIAGRSTSTASSRSSPASSARTITSTTMRSPASRCGPRTPWMRTGSRHGSPNCCASAAPTSFAARASST